MSDDLYMSDPKAKTVEGFIEGLTILAQYAEKGMAHKYGFGAEHDVIHLWLTPLGAVPEDGQDGRRLQALGFHADEDMDQWQYFT